MRKIVYLLILAIPSFAFSNNIQVSNVSLINQNTTLNTYVVKFDLSWENSWRTSTFESNWDAAWLVIKYRNVENTDWNHSNLTVNGSSFPAGVQGEFAGSTGLFIYRSADGLGNFNAPGVEITWNYGVSIPDDAEVEICVIAIEMVYIPEGAFEVGDDSPAPEANFQAGTTTDPFPITSEGALTLGGTAASNLNVLNNSNFPTDDFNNTTTQTLPGAFPKGYAAFYTMKYEISQQQYVDFLNKLPSTATANRYDNSNLGSAGYNIDNTGPLPNIFLTSTPDRACNFISWADIAAYADWIGLRPMSELEYEKMCRGTRSAVIDEFAWGNAFIANQPYNFNNVGQPNEGISNPAVGTGNALYISTSGGVNQPRRCGIFAHSAINKTRQETGASYYGVMELTGNLWDLTVTVGNAEGRQFTGLHGNGIISSDGNSTVGTTWPSTTIVPIADGTGLRGGSSVSNINRLTISSRDLVNFDITGRFSDAGGRLVRTAN